MENILVPDRPQLHQTTPQPLAVRLRRPLLLLLIVGLLVVSYIFLQRTGVLEMLMDAELLRIEIERLGQWGPVALMLLMTTAIVINPIPSAPIALAAGALYGHSWGTLYVVIGAGSGAMIAFLIARLAGQNLLKRLFGERIGLTWLGSQNVMMGMVFISRLLPFISFDLVSYGAGLTPLKLWRFAVATFSGLIPSSFLLAHFGGELAVGDFENTLTTLLLLGLITLIPFAGKALWNWYQNRRQQKR